MRALLLAAGRGERLRPLTDELPKCLVPVNGRPLIDYWLRNLAALGIERFLVNLHYRADVVRAYLESGPFARQIEFAFEESLLGTGGTLLAIRDFVETGTTLVAHADNLCQCDFEAFARAHRARPAGTDLTMMTFRAPDPRLCGIVELDSRGVVTAFHEKVADPPGNLASAAVFIAEPPLIRELAALERKVIDLSRDLLPRMTRRILAWHNTGYHRDIGTPEAWFGAQLEFPGDGRDVGAGHYWSSYCGTIQDAQAARIVQTLRVMWRADEILDPESTARGAGNLLVVAEEFRESRIQRLLERFDPARTLALFWRVPPAFSAARIYRETGLRSIGFCSA